MRFVLALFLLAPVAAAQPGSALERTRARLAAGDSSGAHALARDVLRSDPDAPDAVALNRLRLRLELAGFGVRRLPRPIRQQQIADGARRLLRLAPTDTLALRVLVDDAVWTVLQWHDRVRFGDVSSPYGDFVSPAEIAARMSTSRFDVDDRAAMGPPLERNGRARDASREAIEWLAAWRSVDPTSAPAAAAQATLAALAQDWAGLGAVAERFAPTGDPRADLWAGLAHYRLGDAEAAGVAFDRALPRLAPGARARFEDVRPLLPLDRRDAYDADPEGVAAAFWAEADPRLLTERSERRVEHRARVVEADLLFGRSAGSLWEAPGLGAETEQGALWVRYGRPRRALSFSPGEFGVAAYGDDNFRVWDFEDFQFVFDDPERDGVFRTYSPPARAFAGPGTSARNDDFVMRDREMQRTDPQRTQDLPTLDLPALVSRFRAPGGGTEVVVAWGVPVDSLRAPVRTGAFALADGRVVDREVQERRQLAPGRVVRAGGGPVWAEAAQLHLPSDGAIRVEVESDEGTARGAAAEPVALLPGGFGVSDLLLATSVDDEGRGPVVRDGLGIVPAPRAAFATTDPVYVVLEVYGLGLEDGRTRTTVEATLRPQARRGGLLGRIFGRGQGPGVSVRTEASGDRPDELVSFFVDVRDQDPGRYTLIVTVADATTGSTASAERAVVLE
ncbi:hypothetical protein [Rubrivirga sp.]|uniref:hypothetical protein n=1 Tax=Rubrivirga sp. TaxID=1885344 RepID=UPI003B51F211